MNGKEIIKKVEKQAVEIKKIHESASDVTEYEYRLDLFRDLDGFVSCCLSFEYITCEDARHLHKLIYKEMEEDAAMMFKDIAEECFKEELSKFKELYDKFNVPAV